jgi:Na+/melibiose symporter-like transporter
MVTTSKTNFGRNVRYGSVAFALGMPTLPLLIYLPTIYAEHVGLGLTATGIALFIARLIDVISDPIIGILSDHTGSNFQKKWGRRKPLILVGGLVGILGTIFLLNPQSNSGMVYLTIWAAILYLGWTMISIPYLAWGADLSTNYTGRTKITSIREFFMLAGIIFAGAVPAFAAFKDLNERQAMSIVGWVIIGIGVILFTILLRGVHEINIPTFHQKERPLAAIKGVMTNKTFQILLSGWLLNGIANGIPAVLFIIYMKHVLKADELDRGIFTFIYFFSSIIGIPVWLWLSKIIGKNKTWSISMVLACLSFSFVPWLHAGDLIPFLIIIILTGITLGADLVIPPSMQADVAEYELLRSRHDRTGLLFAFWGMATKLALALSILIAFPLLEFFGFSLNQTENNNNLIALSVIYSSVPVVLKILTICVIWNYPLNEYRQSIIRRKITNLNKRALRDGA